MVYARSGCWCISSWACWQKNALLYTPVSRSYRNWFTIAAFSRRLIRLATRCSMICGR